MSAFHAAPLTTNCKGFAEPLLLYIIAGMAVALLLSWGGLYVQTQRLKATTAAYAGFVANVKTLGEQAEKAAKESERKAKQNKERSDAENKRLRTANESLSRSLLDARTRTGYLPAPGPGTGSPDRITFDRPELERALQQLDAGVSGLIGEGDKNGTDLTTARSWAQGR